jgi:hypothetical protein
MLETNYGGKMTNGAGRFEVTRIRCQFFWPMHADMQNWLVN